MKLESCESSSMRYGTAGTRMSRPRGCGHSGAYLSDCRVCMHCEAANTRKKQIREDCKPENMEKARESLPLYLRKFSFLGEVGGKL